MRGSGLSLERFIKGKAHKTKGEAKSKKKVIVHKAQRRREYEKVKRREASGKKSEDRDGGSGTSFYDRFFQDLQSGKVDVDEETRVRALLVCVLFTYESITDAMCVLSFLEQADATEPLKTEHASAKPDPFFKARKKADVAKQEKQRAREERQRRQAELEKKINQRKKRHVKLSVRTATGQPVVRNHIGDILSKLQAEKANGGAK